MKSAEVQNVERHLKWIGTSKEAKMANARAGFKATSEKAKQFADIQIALQRIEGLAKTKGLCKELVEDALGRVMLGDTHQTRHLIISGGLGSGKRTSARLTAKVLEAMGVAQHLEEDFGTYALLQVCSPLSFATYAYVPSNFPNHNFPICCSHQGRRHRYHLLVFWTTFSNLKS